MIKKLRTILGAILFGSFILTSCGSDDSRKSKKDNKVDEYLDNAEYAKDHNVYTDAISYNDAIVGIHTKVLVEMLAMGKYTDLIDMRKQLAVIQEEIKIALTTINKIYYSGDADQRFKNAALKIFNFYDRIITEDYVAILDLRDITDNEEDYDIANAAYLKMNKIVEKFSAEEAILDVEFEEVQKSFARENRIFIDPSDHPLQEEIDDL
jgi:hypothetical protein